MVSALLDSSVLIDVLIAATAFRLKVPLYTRNLKHFTPILGALAVRPY